MSPGVANLMTPEKPSKPEPTVVGIGASAGGLSALKIFLEHVPQDSGLAFVVVVHLSPDHESHLAELLQPHVRFPVEQVNQTTLLQRNHVYIIPPNANLNAIDTHLRLTKLEERRQERAPIDYFFRTLARAHDGNAIAVVLTGTGSDGTLGVKDIKANGGVVIVQDPNEAEYDGMPQSAIATGLVDFVMPVAEIPASILRFDSVQPRVPVPSDEGEVPPDERMLLHKVFAQLRVRTDRDFSRYKRSTVLRRIARRMQLNYIEDLGPYVERLRERPEEARALADDLLITVTHFFRDPDVFERLEKVEIARLFEKRQTPDTVRAWSVGCATGEEAYSLAMVLVEEASKHEAPPQIQVFASDLHSRSLEKAREGFYPGDIATDVNAERLKRFFQQENGGYRIRKELRDLVVFAPHNLLADPPFSRLDLISCRNLLIYLEREVQQDVIELFHYALNPDGTLLLGSAESVDASDLFRVEDKRLCIFRKRNVPPREPRLPVFPLMRTRLGDDGAAHRAQLAAPIAYGSLHQRMVEKYAPPSILIGADNKILHLSEHAGRYLVHPGGEPTQSALKMVREELRIELQAALHRAREKKEIFDSKPIPVRFNGHPCPVILHVRPSLESDEEGFALVIFDEREPKAEVEAALAGPEETESQRVHHLEVELANARQRLQIIIEEYETSREEMKASNEEMQSTNEELRSTMEELETSKEELQSINEELQTVNQQNRLKVEELDQLSSDLQNLLVATDIATLFLDRDLRILRFTPKLGDLFNIRITDRGRPISDLTHRLGYVDLICDAQGVLNRLVPVEHELQDDAGRWYLTRVHPYRSNDDRIEGVVVTFIDITDRKDAEDIRLKLQKKTQSADSDKAMREKEAELARVSRTLMVGELATSIAHEVNQPLAGVVTNAEAAMRWLDGGAPNIPEAKNSLTLIVRDGNRASSVIRRVREFVKNESNGSTVLDIREIIRDTVALLQFDLEKNQIALHLDFSDQVATIRGDRVQLEQVILNLIVNASEAMAQIKDRQRDLRVSVSSVDGQKVVVSIQDTGVGIDPQQIGKVYDAFFTTKPSGIGMGLSISRSIVEAHGGQILVLPNPGPGVTVQFSLPADRSRLV
jgi:two-component system CheB/CheR fusion protein